MSRVDEAMRRAAETFNTVKTNRTLSPWRTSRSLSRCPTGFDQLSIARSPFRTSSTGPQPIRPLTPWHAPAEGPNAPFGDQVAEKIVIDPRMPGISREQYRRVAAVLHDSQAANRTQVVMVASAVAGEGKTLTAANVALDAQQFLSQARPHHRRRSAPARVARIFRVETSCGLADGLDPSRDAKIVVRQVTPTLSLLPAGRPTSDPMAGLISDRMRRVVDEAREIIRLDHHRHASAHAAAGREPAGVNGRRRVARRAEPSRRRMRWSSAQWRRSADRGYSASCSTARRWDAHGGYGGDSITTTSVRVPMVAQ